MCNSTMQCRSLQFLVAQGLSSFYIRRLLYMMTKENTLVTVHGVCPICTFLEILEVRP
jgi:hypothetical protein